MGSCGENEKVVVERLATSETTELYFFSLKVEMVGRGKNELSPINGILLKPSSNGLEKLLVFELSWNQASRRSHIPVDMSIWRYESDLEGICARSLLENPMSGADSSI